MKFKWDKVILENQCGTSGGGNVIVKYTPTQDFIRFYFTPKSQEKGILLYHSVGVGKTCSAIGAATSTFEKEGYTILWVTRTTLKADIWKNMFEQICSVNIADRLRSGKLIPEEQNDRMRLLSKSWSIRPLSYKQFSNLVSGNNEFYEQLVNKNGKEDPLRKTLLIIDEAHKLYGGTDLSSIERPDMNKLKKAIHHSYEVSGHESVKLMLMTATPYTNDPMELIKIINLLKEKHQQLPDDFDEFSRQYLNDSGEFTQNGHIHFLDEISGYISYLNREGDARQFAQPIITHVRIPMSFPVIENMMSEKVYNEKVSELNTLTQIKSEHLNLITNHYKSIINSTKDTCKDYVKKEKTDCTSKIKPHIQNIESQFKLNEQIIKQELKDIKADLTLLKKKYSEQKKKLEEDPSQYSIIMNKCINKSSPKSSPKPSPKSK